MEQSGLVSGKCLNKVRKRDSKAVVRNHAGLFLSVLRIRIHRIHMFLDLPDPDPDLDPALDLDPDPSIIMQK